MHSHSHEIEDTQNMFRPFEKIHRLGKEETDGILSAPVHVQEKIDGANLQVWMEDGVIHVGSRNNDVTLREDGFNGAVQYVQNHEGVKSLLADRPTAHLYGEWLVKHTITYKATAYGKFYLFDIHDGDFLPTNVVDFLSDTHGIEKPHYYGEMLVTDLEDLKKLVGKSMLGDKGEGIVIKRTDFKNQFGDTVYAKMVAEDFMEDNAIVFGGNNRYSDVYRELWAVNKFMSLPRIRKIMQKIQSENAERMDMKHIPQVMGMAYHDMFQEEMWEIAQKATAPFNFKKFKELANKKSKQIYIDVLNDSISVADQHGEEAKESSNVQIG